MELNNNLKQITHTMHLIYTFILLSWFTFFETSPLDAARLRPDGAARRTAHEVATIPLGDAVKSPEAAAAATTRRVGKSLRVAASEMSELPPRSSARHPRSRAKSARVSAAEVSDGASSDSSSSSSLSETGLDRAAAGSRRHRRRRSSSRTLRSRTSPLEADRLPKTADSNLKDSVDLLYKRGDLDEALRLAKLTSSEAAKGSQTSKLAQFQKQRLHFNRLEPMSSDALAKLMESRALGTAERRHAHFLNNLQRGLNEVEVSPRRWGAWNETMSRELKQPHLTPFERTVGRYHLEYGRLRDIQNVPRYAYTNSIDILDGIRNTEHPGRLSHAKRYQKSIKALRAQLAEERNPKHQAFYNYLLGLAYYQSNKNPRANIEFLSKAIEAGLPPAKLREALHLRTKLYRSLGEYDLARNDLTRITTGKHSPTRAEIENISIINRDTRGSLDAYLGEWIALEIDADRLEQAANLGEMITSYTGRSAAYAHLYAGIANTQLGATGGYFTRKYRQKGLARLQLALESTELTPDERLLGQYYRGTYYFHHQSYAKTISDLAPVIEAGILAPDTLQGARNKYARALYESKRYEEALHQLQEVLKLHKTLGNAHTSADVHETWLQIARAHYYNRDYTNAQRYIDLLKKKESGVSKETRLLVEELEMGVTAFNSRVGGVLDLPFKAWDALW